MGGKYARLFPQNGKDTSYLLLKWWWTCWYVHGNWNLIWSKAVFFLQGTCFSTPDCIKVVFHQWHAESITGLRISWMLSLRPIFLPAVWVNQFELLQSESVSLSDHKIGWSNGGEANQPWERLRGISDDLSLTIRALRWVAPVVFKSQLPVRHNRIYSNSSQLHCKTVLVLGYCM